MASSLSVIVFALAAFVAAQAAVKDLPETASVQDMKQWLDSLRIDTEGLRDKVWDLVIKGKTARSAIEERRLALTNLIYAIIAKRTEINKGTALCDPTYFVAYQVEACENNARAKYTSSLNELKATHASETEATNTFIAANSSA